MRCLARRTNAVAIRAGRRWLEYSSLDYAVKRHGKACDLTTRRTGEGSLLLLLNTRIRQIHVLNQKETPIERINKREENTCFKVKYFKPNDFEPPFAITKGKSDVNTGMTP